MGLHLPDGPEAGPHPDGRPGPTLGMAFTIEGEQQCVTAELHERATLTVRNVEEFAEDVVENHREFLGSHPALAGETFGERRETGDVDETERRIELVPASGGIVAGPLDREARDIGPETAGGFGAHCAGGPDLRIPRP